MPHQESPLPHSAEPCPGNEVTAVDALLERWLELTIREGDAIRRADWPQVGELQALKRTLQPLLDLARSRVPEGRFTNLEPIRRLERTNLDLLVSVRRIAESERDGLQQSRHNLSRLQRSYVARSTSVWETSA